MAGSEEGGCMLKDFIDLKDSFASKEVYEIYSQSMYKPSWHKFILHTHELSENSLISMFGLLNKNDLIGVIVVKKDSQNNGEILGIAVKKGYHQRGIGSRLIDYVFNKLEIKTLFAETDDDAVRFYEKCGFEIKEVIKYKNGYEYKRYECTAKY